MRERMIVRGGWTLGAVLLLVAMGFGLAVPGGLSVPTEAAVAAAQGGACSNTTNCSQSSYCFQVGMFDSIYYHYQGGGVRWYDPNADYGLGKCRIATPYTGSTTCSSSNTGTAITWWICS